MKFNSSTRIVVAALAAVCSLGSGAAGITDVAQQPLLVSSGITIKPNLLFIIDDSGSMAETYLPEAAFKSRFRYAHRSAQCNGLAFDPATAYEVPMTWDRLDYANASAPTFNADIDMENIRSTTQGTVSVKPWATVDDERTLTVSLGGTSWNGTSGANTWYAVGNRVTVYDNNTKTNWAVGTVMEWKSASGAGALKIKFLETRGNLTLNLAAPRVADGYPFFFYFTYLKSGPENIRLNYQYNKDTGNLETAVTPANLFHTECNSLIVDGSSVFSKPTNLLTVSDDLVKTRFYNWYLYHSDRMKMMKTVVSRAFAGVDDRFRIGFNTILNTSAKETLSGGGANNRFLHVRDFKETREAATPTVPSQREKFYTRLMATPPTNTTPLRASLSMAGRYFANKLGSNQDYDPVQYSCQKNFVILSSDGAWNTGAESGSFGPYQLNGSTLVDQQDSEAQVTGDSLALVLRDNGFKNSLADVAMYYYKTDLRTPALGNCVGNMGVDVCKNDVKTSDTDPAEHQHLTTYTLSLGQNGSVKYQPDYLKNDKSAYHAMLRGELRWPNPTTDAYKVDDLWHAAVNGRGQFFNGSDAKSVADGIRSVIKDISAQTGSGSAAAASTLRPVEGNNLAFIAEFTTGEWVGDVRAYTITLKNGDIERSKRDETTGRDNELWSAARSLKEGVVAGATRKLLVAKGGSLVPFTYDNAKDGGHLDNKCTLLSQCIGLTSDERKTANDGKELVSYLSGKEFEGVFRKRLQVLGDIVSSAPVYDGPIASRYADTGYAEFAGTRLLRTPVVYAGANDGFLHAFYAGKAEDPVTGFKPGQEMWAFSPTAVRQHLYKLADDDYSNKHRFFVDGPATLADVSMDGTWKTILVFGLGAGGNQYTALDVTDPVNPKLLWEFTNANLGMTHAKPIVTKRKSTGQWVVVVPSGYNNTTGDGKGHLFMLNVKTGAIVEDIATKGDAANPTGLGPLNSWVEADADNTALRFYAGDNSGNVWRFDTEGLLGPKGAMLLAEFGDKQPITTAPVLAEVDFKGVKNPVVYVGTGRSVGMSDLSDPSLQSIYGIKDPLTAAGWGKLRGSGKLVEQTLVIAGEKRTVTKNPVDWAKQAGWQVDLTDPVSQRINIPMQLFGNTLIAAANVPITTGTCQAEGDGVSYIYYLDIASGGADDVDFISKSQLAGFTILTLPNGINVVSGIPVKGDDVTKEVKPAANYSNKASRANWRTLSGR